MREAAENRPAGDEGPADLEDVLATLRDAGGDAEVTVADMVEAFGHRSIGALLLLPALVTLIPGVGAIPGLPTVCAVLSVLIAGQILVGHSHLWLPEVLRRRKIARGKLEKGLRYAAPAARLIDRLVRPRLTVLTRGPAVRLLAGLTILIALTMPPLEIVPMAGIVPAAAIAIFGLAVVAQDGLLAALGLIVAGGTGYLVWQYLL